RRAGPAAGLERVPRVLRRDDPHRAGQDRVGRPGARRDQARPTAAPDPALDLARASPALEPAAVDRRDRAAEPRPPRAPGDPLEPPRRGAVPRPRQALTRARARDARAAADP